MLESTCCTGELHQSGNQLYPLYWRNRAVLLAMSLDLMFPLRYSDVVDLPIHKIFELQVVQSPDAIALRFPNLATGTVQCLTYAELNQQANGLARQLQLLGVGLETNVAICLERSPHLIIAILAILKAGGVYVPLDPAYPQERLAWMLMDTQAPVILTQSSLVEQLPPQTAKVVVLDQLLVADVGELSMDAIASQTSKHLAYINYTSGSTGTPKGVTIPHRAISRLVFDQQYATLNGQQVTLQLAPISFDAATFEIWGALLHGGCCVLFPGKGIPDFQDLRQVISSQKITTLWLTAALFNTIIMEAPDVLVGVEELLTGGEALSVPHIQSALALLPKTQLINGYGPTESTTFTCCYRIPRSLPASISAIPIGQAIAHTSIHILDSDRQPVADGAIGELYIGGDGLACGYLNRPDLTDEKFIVSAWGERLYKTGDRVKYLPDGNLTFVGRTDHQVKLRGFRIELGEIELVLRRSLREAIVVMREDVPGQPQLVAYGVPDDMAQFDLAALKVNLNQQLPDYMVPSAIVILEQLPLNLNGKVDRQALPVPAQWIATALIAPSSHIERQLAALWCGVLGLDQISVEDNFFELGGTSILGLRLMARVQRQLGINVRAVKLYEYPTVRSMAKWLEADRTEENRQVTFPSADVADALRLQHQRTNGMLPRDRTEIAIVGMVGRFPGAESVDQFWANICAGKESTTQFQMSELDPFTDVALRHDPDYVAARGVIEGGESFDAAFFNISRLEAEVMDPQARILLELTHQALETVGYVPEQFDGAIGLYAGTGQNTYFERHICGRTDLIERLGEFQTMLANEKDFAVMRAAYKLNLTGPAVSVSTACSTSLVAVIQAVQALQNRQCEMAIAGGVSMSTPQNRGYLYQEAGMLSPDGKCRPFDAQSQGTMFNNGAGLVVLKRLTDAELAGDRIYAVIRGTGLNNDGSGKVSFTAPSVKGQMQAIVQAQQSAGISPATLSYIETHGTATALGDPIELEALTQAFQANPDQSFIPKQFCVIGSVKGNVGHLVAAAGVAGLIKTALALYHRKLPPSINFETPNPQLDLENSPFYVNTQLMDWTTTDPDQPRRAGVSSFGVGGTNAHVILEEVGKHSNVVNAANYTDHPTGNLDVLDEVNNPQILLLSAKSSTALEQATSNLQTYLEQNPSAKLADVAYTLQVGRKSLTHRRFLISDSPLKPPIFTSQTVHCDRHPSITFLFPGQGSQYINMGRQLYAQYPVYREAIAQCCNILQPILGEDLRDILYADPQDTAIAEVSLKQTRYTQPAIFITEYALAQLWISWGIVPEAMLGHSIGEFVAACLAGVFSLPDALLLVATRAKLMDQLPTGAMLSVRLAATEVQPYLTAGLAIAAINAPSLCVVSGETAAIAELEQALANDEIACRRLHTSHAFHSEMMSPVVEPFAAVVRTIQLSKPRSPFVSTVTGNWISDAEATDPMYWATHLRETVRFADAIATLWQDPDRVLLEVGPRNTATTLARQQVANPKKTDAKRQVAIASLGDRTDSEWTELLTAVGRLWLTGAVIDWESFHRHKRRQRLPLPTYPFERQRFWIDPLPPVQAPEQVASQVNQTESTASTIPASSNIHSSTVSNLSNHPMSDSAKQVLIPILKELFEDTSGIDVSAADDTSCFLELGLDSLTLTQVALTLKKKFKVKLSFRQLLEDYTNFTLLADHLLPHIPSELQASASSQQSAPQPSEPSTAVTSTLEPSATNPQFIQPALSPTAASMPHNNTTNLDPFSMAGLVNQQLQLMARQLELLQSSPNQLQPLSSSSPSASPPVQNAEPSSAAEQTAVSDVAPKKSFGPGAKIEKTIQTTLTPVQQQAIARIIDRYIQRTPESKRQTQEHRRYLADPRTVSGFTPLLKEIVYPIVTHRASGSKLWDVDGNEYIDLTNGFGLNFFGWSPQFVTDAVTKQMREGIEIGPQTPLAGRVAKLVTEFVNMERVAFCNTGSEAVMAAMRLARTVTGRSTIVIFAGDYHGTFDEVIVRSGAKLKSFPAAPGIMPSMFENILVLEYGTEASLQIIRDRADELAAVMVEPVQSRRPELQPQAFLQELRQITAASETALIFDEVVTGFRVHPGGAQAYFGIEADIATYGKVVGGGLPIGILAGKSMYLDALDGGYWEFGDDSIPEVGVTFFAGTFVRHPMALAAAEAVLLKLKEGGEQLQESLSQKVTAFVDDLKDYCDRVQAPIQINNFRSFFYVTYAPEATYGGLLFYLLREKGIHIWEHRPCFFTLAHSDADIAKVSAAFKESIAELQAAGLIPAPVANEVSRFDRNVSPQPGARLGRDPEGNPAWYIPDPDRPGKYLQVSPF
jgi:amino acid adenylation domain-containing protein